jgi:DNA-binding response OmpR family regulator
MTAFPEWFENNKTLAAGCDAYFVKPLNTRTLSQQVAEVVARKAQGGGLKPAWRSFVCIEHPLEDRPVRGCVRCGTTNFARAPHGRPP